MEGFVLSGSFEHSVAVLFSISVFHVVMSRPYVVGRWKERHLRTKNLLYSRNDGDIVELLVIVIVSSARSARSHFIHGGHLSEVAQFGWLHCALR
jgi:hypothetical protein